MTRRRNGCGGCAVPLLVLLMMFVVAPLTMVLVAPGIVLHLHVRGSASHQAHLSEWLWYAAASLPLAVLLVRLALNKNGRLRGSTPAGKRWLGITARGAVLLGAMNAVVFTQLDPPRPGGHVIDDGMAALVLSGLAGIVVLGATAWWDRRPRPVTVREVRVAAAEADRALRRVRAENDRVRRQADAVQARLTKIRARSPARRPAGPTPASTPCARSTASPTSAPTPRTWPTSPRRPRCTRCRTWCAGPASRRVA